MDDGQLSNTAKVILGLIRMGLRTGYEMKQLEDAGLITGEDDSHGGRTRRAYALTAAGERAFRDWLTSDADPILEMRDEAMLKLFFASELTDAELQELLRLKIEQHERTAAALRQIEPAERPADNDCPFLVLDYGIAHHEWSADWYRKLALRLADGR